MTCSRFEVGDTLLERGDTLVSLVHLIACLRQSRLGCPALGLERLEFGPRVSQLGCASGQLFARLAPAAF